MHRTKSNYTQIKRGIAQNVCLLGNFNTNYELAINLDEEIVYQIYCLQYPIFLYY